MSALDDDYDPGIDDLNACYQRPPRVGRKFAGEWERAQGMEWRTPFTLTESQPGVPSSLHESYRRVLDEAGEIWTDRQSQYGMTPFPEKPSVLLSLCQVKLWRLEQDFGAEDGWLDLLNYAAIGLMVARGEWE